MTFRNTEHLGALSANCGTGRSGGKILANESYDWNMSRQDRWWCRTKTGHSLSLLATADLRYLFEELSQHVSTSSPKG